MLDAVSPGFVERVPAGHVGIDFPIVIITHGYLCDAQVAPQVPVGCPDHANAGIDLVGAVAQFAQHFRRLGRVPRFAQDGFPVHHGGIGSNDDGFLDVAVAAQARALLSAKPQDISPRLFAGVLAFIDFGGGGFEFPSAECKQFPPAWGVRRQYQARVTHGRDSNTLAGSPSPL